MQPIEFKYSTFCREILVFYLAVRQFRHALQGQSCKLFTDHKPLVYALHSYSDRHFPNEILT